MVSSQTEEAEKALEDLLAACAAQRGPARSALIPGRPPDPRPSPETAGKEGDAR